MARNIYCWLRTWLGNTGWITRGKGVDKIGEQLTRKAENHVLRRLALRRTNAFSQPNPTLKADTGSTDSGASTVERGRGSQGYKFGLLGWLSSGEPKSTHSKKQMVGMSHRVCYVTAVLGPSLFRLYVQSSRGKLVLNQSLLPEPAQGSLLFLSCFTLSHFWKNGLTFQKASDFSPRSQHSTWL